MASKRLGWTYSLKCPENSKKKYLLDFKVGQILCLLVAESWLRHAQVILGRHARTVYVNQKDPKRYLP